MKKYMKLVSLGLTGAMALSLAACGGSGSSAATGETGSDAGSASTAATDEVVTIKWITVGNGMPSNYDAWLEQVNSYLEEKVGVSVDMEVVG